MTYGFIITRHVTSEKTNHYWNLCIERIRRFYPDKLIVIIDDNSNKNYVKKLHKYTDNIRYIDSEYKGAGELLPFYYLQKERFFSNAVIIHDSVFFQMKIKFELLENLPILPLWHFKYSENIGNCIRLLSYLSNAYTIRNKVIMDPIQTMAFRREDKWFGCFGLQTYISISFLDIIWKKYSISRLLPLIRNREDRCSLERVLGAIFYTENPLLVNSPSLLGNIWKYEKWGTTFDDYIQKKIYANKPLIKIWTGR